MDQHRGDLVACLIDHRISGSLHRLPRTIRPADHPAGVLAGLPVAHGTGEWQVLGRVGAAFFGEDAVHPAVVFRPDGQPDPAMQFRRTLIEVDDVTLGIRDDHAERRVLETTPWMTPEGPRLIETDTRHLTPVTMSGRS